MTPGRIVTVTWAGQMVLPRLSRLVHQRLEGGFTWGTRTGTEGHLFYVTEGQAWFDVDGETHRAAPGTVFLFLPGRNYRLRAAGREGFALYHGHFRLERAHRRTVTGDLRAWAQIASRLDATASRRARSLHLPEGFLVPDRRVVETLFTRVIRAQLDVGPGCDLAAGAAFLLLLQAVSRQLLASFSRPQPEAALNRKRLRVVKALDFIERELARPLGLHEVAQHLGVNAAYMARLFRQETGTSVGRYILHRKMAAASERLARGNLSVKEVAASLGFTDPLYFSRRFREAEGMAPSEYMLRENL